MTSLLDAVAAAMADVPRVYPLGSVPNKPGDTYGTYSAVLGGGGAYTLDSRHGLKHGLVSVQTFGKTQEGASAYMQKFVDRLLDSSLSFDGYQPTTPLRAAIDQPAINRDPDDNGVITVTMPFTFTAAKEL